jgi:zinc transport system substrate-binding protein
MAVRLERFLLLALVLLAGALPASAPCGAKPLGAFVSILPQACFLERVGGDHVQVDVLVGPGESPATHEPTPREIAALEKADVYFRIGTPFENAFVEKIARTMPGLRIVDTRRGVELRFFRPDGERQVPDPHIWLDPMRVKIQSRTMCDTLSELVPGLGGEFEDNLRAFHQELDAVDRRIREVLAPLRSRKILVFHPAFGYFCDAYGLEQVAVETEGKAPGPKRLADLIDMARAEGIRVIFVQPQYSKKSARTIAEAISGAVVPLDPLARDYLGNLRRMAEALREGLAP